MEAVVNIKHDRVGIVAKGQRRILNAEEVPLERLGLPDEGLVSYAVDIEAVLTRVDLIMQVAPIPMVLVHDRLVAGDVHPLDPGVEGEDREGAFGRAAAPVHLREEDVVVVAVEDARAGLRAPRVVGLPATQRRRCGNAA